MTALAFHPPRISLAEPLVEGVRSTLSSRDDVRRAWWVTVEYLNVPAFQEELHIELVEPPGADGAGLEVFAAFEWRGMPLGPWPVFTFTPGWLVPRVQAVATCVWERDGDA